jgi:hypothetical protein
MTLRQVQLHADPHALRAQRPRLRLKPKGPETGYVDGAWWPHGHDLAAELPELLAVLSARLGPVHRVIYHLDEWAEVPAKLVASARRVRLDGFRHHPAHTLAVYGVNRSRVVLLVVSPYTPADYAYTTMVTAAAPGNVSPVEDLL